jgi:hypothetical protein
MKWSTSFVILLLLGVAASVAVPANGEVVLFQDNFESYAPVSPLTQPGWTLDLGTTGQAWSYQAALGGDCPGPQSGASYMIELRGSSPWIQVNGTFPTQSTLADLVRFEADVYGSPSAYPYLATMSGTHSGSETNYVMMGPNGTVYIPTTSGTSATLTWATGSWHHVTIDYHPTAATFDLMIDAQTQLAIPMVTVGQAVSGFCLSNAAMGNWASYDNVKVSLFAVPEPSSVALLVSAVFGLVAYAWRKRR